MKTAARATPSQTPAVSELVAAARKLIPLLKKNAAAAEDKRDLPDDSMAALKAACIEDPQVIEKILAHLDKKTTDSPGGPPPCRAPPQRGLFDSAG